MPRFDQKLSPGMAYLLPMLLAAAVVVLVGMGGDGNVGLEPQAYTRLARLERMLTESWLLAGFEPREFPATGHMLHWTLPIDTLLLLCAWPFAQIFGWDIALPFAVGLMGPASYLAMMIALIWASRPLGGPLVQMLAGLLALTIPAAISFARPGVADASLLMAALWLVFLGSLLRIGSGEWKDRGAVTAGFLSGLLLWMSISTIPALAICWLAFGLHAAARGGTALKQGMIAISTFALTLVVGAMLDSGMEAWSIYRISLTYAMIGPMGICAFAAPVIVLRRDPEWVLGRVGGFIVVSIALGAFYLMGWTGLLLADDSLSGGYARALWWDRLGNLQPADALVLALAFLGHALCGLMAAAALALRGRRRLRPGSRMFWMLAVGVTALLMFIGAIHVPLGLYAELSGTLCLSVALSELWHYLRGNVRRPFAVPAFGTIVMIVAIAVPVVAARLAPPTLEGDALYDNGRCNIADIAVELADQARTTGSRLILAQPRFGPELLHRLPEEMAIVSGPWSSNAEGLALIYQVLAGQDMTLARRLLENNDVDLILICASQPGPAILRADPDRRSLFFHLARGETPGWAIPLGWPEILDTDFRLYQIRPTPGEE